MLTINISVKGGAFFLRNKDEVVSLSINSIKHLLLKKNSYKRLNHISNQQLYFILVKKMEPINYPSKLCHYCKKEIRGRSDKKFCNDYCRNIYNNQLHSIENNLIRNINYALGKNRRILDELASAERIVKIKKEELLYLGFHFKYHTHNYKSKTGTVLYGCYDFFCLLFA